ncbi:MAG: sulfatase, partial [Mycobacterium sp.]
GLRHEIGEALEAGTAVIITVVYPNGRAPVETTLVNADTVRELRMDKNTITNLEAAVAEAMAQIGHSTEPTLNAGTTGTKN